MPARGEPHSAAQASLSFLVIGMPPRAFAFAARDVQRVVSRRERGAEVSWSLGAALGAPAEEDLPDLLLHFTQFPELALAVRGPSRVIQVPTRDVLPMPSCVSASGLYTALILRDGIPSLLALDPRRALQATGASLDCALATPES